MEMAYIWEFAAVNLNEGSEMIFIISFFIYVYKKMVNLTK